MPTKCRFKLSRGQTWRGAVQPMPAGTAASWASFPASHEHHRDPHYDRGDCDRDECRDRQIMISLALVYCSQRALDWTSMGLSFHCLSGSWMRMRKRNCCSSSLMENQYFSRMMPEPTSMRSNSGTEWKNSWYCSSVQNPITRSTPARLYQLRSNRTTSPPAGRCAT